MLPGLSGLRLGPTAPRSTVLTKPIWLKVTKSALAKMSLVPALSQLVVVLTSHQVACVALLPVHTKLPGGTVSTTWILPGVAVGSTKVRTKRTAGLLIAKLPRPPPLARLLVIRLPV